MRYTADSTAFISMLLESGADPAIPGEDGRSGLQLAEDLLAGQMEERGATKEGGFLRNYRGVVDLLKAWTLRAE
jgi:hypothetical protein